jgi:LmbE family N-acetylglucosaminyl deacetylase
MLNFVAHQDDDLLFLSPSLLYAIQAGNTIRTVYLTAGDDGMSASYWQSRESGVKAAYSEVVGVSDSWTQSDAGVTGHPIPVFTLSGQSNVSLAFMRLPDGNIDGSGFPSTGHQSLEDLWTGSITTIEAVDGSSSYTLSTLESTLVSLITAFSPAGINTLDYVGSYGDGDHSDHHSVAYLTQAAVGKYTSSVTFTGYKGYPMSSLAVNLSDSDQELKDNAFFAYTPYDSQICQSLSSCASTSYDSWLDRQYTVTQAQMPVANAGGTQNVSTGASVTLDGSGSVDPAGYSLSYQWTQTGGTSVTLSTATAVRPTFTASSATTLTFQLVVTDSQGNVSSPATVAITVARVDLALTATATASSQNTSSGQTAAKAIDGIISGYPNASAAEWATVGGGAGSWLKLAWSTPQTIDTIVLYDRPNLSDQITGGNIAFSDGTSIAVGTLPNAGSAYTLSFTAKTITTLQLNITSVSSTTGNVGLSEIQAYNI